MTDIIEVKEKIKIRNNSIWSLQYKVYRGEEGELCIDIDPVWSSADLKKKPTLLTWEDAEKQVRRHKIVYCMEWPSKHFYLYMGTPKQIYKHVLTDKGAHMSAPYYKEHNPDDENFFVGE